MHFQYGSSKTLFGSKTALFRIEWARDTVAVQLTYDNVRHESANSGKYD